MNSLLRFWPFCKYCIVGFVGTGIDLGVVFLLVEYGDFSPLLASFFGFLLAVVHNFFLNKIWTFHAKSKNTRKLFVKFLLVSGVGLSLTLLLMFLFVEVLGVYYLLAKLFVSALVVVWNFLANKYWTFTIRSFSTDHLPSPIYDLSVILPAFNEEKRLPSTLLRMQEFFQKDGRKVEFLVVDDGSTDKTKEVVLDLQKQIPTLQYYSLLKNQGKGAACQKGVLESRGKYILLADADNSTPIEEILSLEKYQQKSEICIGSRYLPESHILKKQHAFRIALGRMANWLIQLFVIDGIVDTQCGFKLLHHKAARDIFLRQKVKRFGFDIELLAVGKSLGYRICEVPISWKDHPESRVRPIKDAFRTFFDLMYIKVNLWSGRYKEDY